LGKGVLLERDILILNLSQMDDNVMKCQETISHHTYISCNQFIFHITLIIAHVRGEHLLERIKMGMGLIKEIPFLTALLSFIG